MRMKLFTFRDITIEVLDVGAVRSVKIDFRHAHIVCLSKFLNSSCSQQHRELNRLRNHLSEIPLRRTQLRIPIHTHRDKSAVARVFQHALHKVQSNLFSNLRHNGVNYGNARAAGGN
jgi:hypothetical protein